MWIPSISVPQEIPHHPYTHVPRHLLLSRPCQLKINYSRQYNIYCNTLEVSQYMLEHILWIPGPCSRGSTASLYACPTTPSNCPDPVNNLHDQSGWSPRVLICHTTHRGAAPRATLIRGKLPVRVLKGTTATQTYTQKTHTYCTHRVQHAKSNRSRKSTDSPGEASGRSARYSAEPFLERQGPTGLFLDTTLLGSPSPRPRNTPAPSRTRNPQVAYRCRS